MNARGAGPRLPILSCKNPDPLSQPRQEIKASELGSIAKCSLLDSQEGSAEKLCFLRSRFSEDDHVPPIFYSHFQFSDEKYFVKSRLFP
jgi:hypothetical protein